jgi:gas vesicle protein
MHETLDDRGSSSGGSFMTGLCVGVAVGAALGLVLAPKRGSELRQQLSEGTRKLRRKANETYNQASRIAGDTYQRATGTLNAVVHRGKHAVEKGKDAYPQARDEVNVMRPNGPVMP